VCTSDENIPATRLKLYSGFQENSNTPSIVVVVSDRVSVWKAVARNN
jgi:hypothetical protein